MVRLVVFVAILCGCGRSEQKPAPTLAAAPAAPAAATAAAPASAPAQEPSPTANPAAPIDTASAASPVWKPGPSVMVEGDKVDGAALRAKHRERLAADT